MDLLRQDHRLSCINQSFTPTNLLVGAVPLVLLGLSRINWPRLIFRFLFAVVAPTKERIWPSDDASLSPQVRGLAWALLSGPPPPHDVKPIRTMMKYFWPNVWPPEGNVQVKVVPTPRTDSESLWITPPSASKPLNACLIHIHGGGMVAGTTGTERGLAVELARRLNVPVLSVDYRLVPESSVEEGVEDVVAAYQWIRTNHPHLSKISVLGGSAGAAHSLLSAIQLQDLGEQQPASLVLSSPAPGMEFLPKQEGLTWKSLQTNAPKDGYMAGNFYQYVTGVVYGNESNQEYFRQQLSKLDGLPPCLVTAGSYEVILDGAQALVQALKEAKVPVIYKEYWKMQHCHFAFFEFTPESSDALDEIITWLQTSWE